MREIGMDRRTVLGLGAAALTTMAARAETMTAQGTLSTDPTEIIPLWPGTPPGGEGVTLAAKIVERSSELDAYHDRFVSQIGTPLLSVFRPEKPDGSAVLLAPGGGYRLIVIDKEGVEAARRLNASGVTVFILRYRLPAEGWTRAADVPLQDAQRAMRLTRARAREFGIDPNRVGVMGFSAGGHVAASLATRHGETVYAPVDEADKQEARPNFAALMYPVITMGEGAHPGSRQNLIGVNPTPEQVAAYSCEKRAGKETPPCFICLSADDDVVPPEANGIAMAAALRAAQVPNELHVFQEGAHGYGIRLARGKPCAAWPDLLVHWAWRGGWFRGPGASI
jgi:acetyl esterase/lipase